MEEKTLENEKKYEDHPADDVLPDPDFDAEGAEFSEPGHHSEDEKPRAESEAPEGLPTTDSPSPSTPCDDLPDVDAKLLKQLDGRLESIAETEQRLFSEVREMHKLYHSEFAGRLKTSLDKGTQPFVVCDG